jgi:elongation factor Ts
MKRPAWASHDEVRPGLGNETMAEVTAAMVRELRDLTDAPMMDCKKALGESNGNMQAAIDWLRQKGISKAAKKIGREMKEGRVTSYVHSNQKVGVLLELTCETDFCARNPAFEQAAKDIAMHIAAADPAPLSVDATGIPADALAAEKKIYEEQAKNSGKPEKFWPQIVDGRVQKYVKERALLDQPFVKNPDLTIGALVTDLVTKLSENIAVRRFVKFRLGE